jgi:hypothetical protein
VQLAMSVNQNVENMCKRKSTFITLLITVFLLTIAGSAFAQSDYTSKSGLKYPEKAKIDLKKPIGPGTLARERSGQDQKYSGGHSGEVTVHLDSMISYSGYEGNTIKEISTYDCDGNLMTLLTKRLVGSSWDDYLLYSFTYDTKGNVLSETDQYWDGIEWVDFLIFTYTYDHHGKLLTVLYNDLYYGFLELITSAYDTKGNRVSELGKVWNGAEFENMELYTYTYNSNNDMKTMLGQYWNGAAWENSVHESWTYNPKHKWLTDLVKLWDGAEWTNYSKFNSSYDSRGNQVSYLGSLWIDGSGWVMITRNLYTYDAKNNMVSNLTQKYANWGSPPYWYDTDSTATDFNYQEKEITGFGYKWNGSKWVRGDTRIYIPFMDHGNNLVFANEYYSVEVQVYYSPIEFKVEGGDDATIYIGYPPLSTQLNASGAFTYSWSPTTGLSDPNIPNPVANPAHTTTYKVTGIDRNGCTTTDKVTVTVIDVRCGKKMDKVLVCYAPPGHQNHAYTICVNKNDVPELLAHGSSLGPCQGEPDSPSLKDSDVIEELSIMVSPNPISEAFSVKIYTPLTERFEINLYNSQGRMIQKIYSGELESGEHQIEVQSIDSPAKGMFFLNVVSPSESKTVKLIKL